MKKLLLILSASLSVLLSFSQDEFAKLQAGFEKMLKDPKNIYGKNTSAGKYYNIRRFNECMLKFMDKVSHCYSFTAKTLQNRICFCFNPSPRFKPWAGVKTVG